MMRAKLQQVASLPFYPLLVASHSVLHLYVHNVELLTLSAILVPLGIVLGSVLAIYLLCRLALKADTSAGIIATSVAAAILYYGYVYDFVGGILLQGVEVNPMLAVGLWLLPFLAVIAFAVWKRLDVPSANGYLNLIALALVVTTLLPLLRLPAPAAASAPQNEVINISPPAKGDSLGARIELEEAPDVYYIILDGYAREDILLDYGFDNSEFLDGLRARGFYIADESHSNYSQTSLSLTSSLNMDYLDRIIDLEAAEEQGTGSLYPLIRNNRVLQEFKGRGYKTIHLASAWLATESNEFADQTMGQNPISEFGAMLFNRTVLRPFAPDFPLRQQQRTILAAFEQLKRLPQDDAPTFAFAHIVAPHPPFIFDRDGNLPVTGEEAEFFGGSWRPLEAYADMVYYINQQVEATVDSILAQSDTPPIIIIQSDHGPGPFGMHVQERMPILNAYYLPEGGNEYLYLTITPVNTFRLIFDLYFGGEFGLLEDEQFFSFYETPFTFCYVIPGMLEEESWPMRAASTLEENSYRVDPTSKCNTELFLPVNAGLYEVDRSRTVWAGPVLTLQLPVQTNEDYLFRARVNHILSDEDQLVSVYIDDQLINTLNVPIGSHEMTVVVPADQLEDAGDRQFIRLRIEHSITSTGAGNDMRLLSLQYRWFEWAPLSEAAVLPSQNEDILKVTRGEQASIFLSNRGWYSMEKHGGEQFRWVNNDAELYIVAPEDRPTLQLLVEAGPGLSYAPFELQLLDSEGQVVATAAVEGRETVELELPLDEGESGAYRLHVENGGQQFAPNDPRTLNFRVFSLGWAR